MPCCASWRGGVLFLCAIGSGKQGETAVGSVANSTEREMGCQRERPKVPSSRQITPAEVAVSASTCLLGEERLRVYWCVPDIKQNLVESHVILVPEAPVRTRAHDVEALLCGVETVPLPPWVFSNVFVDEAIVG